MKIAVYIVGQWRGASYQCSKNLKKIFDKFDTDYYINIWPYYEGKNMVYSVPNGHPTIIECEKYFHTEEDLENIKNTYSNVVSFQVESKEDIDVVYSKPNTFFQYYCAYKANECRKIYEKQNDIKYDVIIKIRPDIIFGDLDIEDFIKYIEYIKDNPTALFSYYYISADNLKADFNLVWDYYTISSPFLMDCMVKWVSDILSKGSADGLFSSNYIIKYNLIINPILSKCNTPTPYIMRELYKHNNLIEDFYNEINFYKNNMSDPNCYFYQIHRYIYYFDSNMELSEYLKISKEDLIPTTNETWMYLTPNGLKRIADLIKQKYYENNIHAKDN